MNTLETIFTRKSVRQFKNQKVDEKDIKTILKAGMSGPTCVQLRRALDSDWERYYAAAKQMTAEGKTLDVPRSYRFGGVAVGRWLENQRLVRAGKKKGPSPPSRPPGWTKSA